MLFSNSTTQLTLTNENSADIATGFKYFLPALFVGESIWRHCWRFVVPAFENSGFILERTVWYLLGFWIGLLNNVILDDPPNPSAIVAQFRMSLSNRSRSTGSQSAG